MFCFTPKFIPFLQYNSTRYGLDVQGIEPRLGARFSAPKQTGPGGQSAYCTIATGSFPVVKQSVRGVDHPPPSSVEVKERVQLYIYCPLGLRGLFWGELSNKFCY